MWGGVERRRGGGVGGGGDSIGHLGLEYYLLDDMILVLVTLGFKTKDIANFTHLFHHHHRNAIFITTGDSRGGSFYYTLNVHSWNMLAVYVLHHHTVWLQLSSRE